MAGATAGQTTQVGQRKRRYIFILEYPAEVLDLFEEYEETWYGMIREDTQRIVAKQGYPGPEGLGAGFAIAREFPPEDLVIAFIKRVKPELLDELIEKRVVKRGGEDITEPT